MNFSNAAWFHLLWLLVPFTLLHLHRQRRARRFTGVDKSEKGGEKTLLLESFLSLQARRHIKYALFLMAFFFFVLAMAGPRWGMKERVVERRGIDIVVAFDLSRSMLTADISPSRIERAKLELATFIDSRRGDRIGLVAFAGNAIVACPLTLDYGAVKNFLKNLTVGMIPSGGTDLAGAIGMSADLLKGYGGREKVVVLITDGEDTLGDPLGMARNAAEEGIALYTLGFGTRQGGPVPVYDKGGKMVDYKKNSAGETVISRIDEALLTKIAHDGGGVNFMGAGAITSLMAELDRKEKSLISSSLFTLMEERFQLPLFIAFLFFSLEIFFPERRKSA